MNEEKLSDAVMQAVRSGHTIQAIKRLRAERGLGLKEAKDIIDREVDAYRLANPNAPMVQKSSGALKVVVIALIAAALYWYLTKGG
ncbi:MAG: 50S ribosomal protein L7/L12 [Gammaproteobacteria bacterium]|nr:50S ribosomal protein L7/L12 [Gammaproteobacteria bacterium]